MGNQLEKEYNIKTKPMKLAGTYDFLRFIDHPSQPDKSLIIMKPPHKIGVIKDSSVILPIISIKQLSSCTVAICPKSIPLVLLKPQSQAQLKIIIYKLIKNGTQLGRCFFSQGRITIWAEQKRGYGGMSPQQFQNSKISERSSVFTAGIAVANYLNCIYEKSKKSQKGQKNKPKVESLISSAMKKDKQETQLLFDPKDRKQYTDMLKNLPKKLKSSHFWDSLSDSMQNLLCMMLQVDKNNRIDKKALLFSSDFMDQKQLLLYITIADDLQNMQRQSALLFVEVLQFLIGQEKLIQKRLLEQYFIPVMMKLLAQSPLLIASCLIEVPNPPTKQIYVLFRKCPSKCQPIFRLVLRKRSKLHKIMSQDQYNGSVSRITFCSFECHDMLEQLMLALPFFMKTVTQENYKKQFMLLLINKVINNELIEHHILLLGLKASISILNEQSFTDVTKFYCIQIKPLRYPLQVNLHFLRIYALMIEKMQPQDMLKIMMPKLQPFLSSVRISDQLFYMSQNCLKNIMKKLQNNRNSNQVIQLQYDSKYFCFPETDKQKNLVEKKQHFLKQVLKDGNPHINWLKKSLGYVQVNYSKKDIMNDE